MSKQKSKKLGQKLSIRKQKILPAKLSKKLQLAYSFHQKNDLNQAQALYQQILSEQPSHAETNFLLGMLVFNDNQYEKSEHLISKAASLCPTEVRYLMGLGILYLHTRQIEKATQLFEKASNLAPGEVEPLYNLGTALSEQTKFHEAKKCFEKVLKLNPKHLGSLNNMGNALLGLCQIESANTFYLKAFEQSPQTLNTLSNTLLTYNYFENLSPEKLFEKHTQSAKRFPKKKNTIKYKEKDNKKIRIAYVSADFKTHSVAYFLLPLLKNHDRSQFEIFCFYNADVVDQITRQFQSLSDNWKVIKHISDNELTTLLLDSEIDILVDLSGHTSNNRMAVLASRVAAVQITWLGYPHSTAIPEMDMRIVDEITDPSPHSDHLSTEALLRLPNGFLCYEGDADISYPKHPPVMENGFVTFGSFNNLVKVNQGVIKAWSKILASVPNSKLIIKAKQLSEESVQALYTSYFNECGIDQNRISFLPRLASSEDHLFAYNQIDIALDTFPYNGTTTTCEAMWMGTPTITFPGNRHAARVGASIMAHAGFPELVAEDLESFIAKAIELASKKEELLKVRTKMRERMQSSDLCNAKQFTLQMESVFKASIQNLSNTRLAP